MNEIQKHIHIYASDFYVSISFRENEVHKMKKILKKVFLAFIALALTGCMKINITLDVASDGSLTETVTMLYQEKMISTVGDIDAALEELKQSFLESYPDAKIETVRTEGEDPYAGVKASGIKNTEYYAHKEGTKLTVEIPVNELQADMSQEAGYNESEIDMSTLKEYGFEAVLVVNMPGKPETNAGVVEGKTVTIDLTSIPKDLDTIIITCSTFNVALWIGLSVAACGIIAGLILFFKKKKK